MADNIDFDASGILEQGMKISQVGDELFQYAMDVASGTRLASEVLDVRETAISRFERSL
jgi:altronate dehydratase large subunit